MLFGNARGSIRMFLAEQDWDACQKLVEQFRRAEKGNGAYCAAVLALEKGDAEQAGREVDTLRQLAQSRKSDKTLERRLWEAQGRYLCQKGDGEAGLKLLRKLVDATKNDYFHHAWGNGAVYMESWGVAALEAGSATDAEEAFQEALAHDAGSVRGALGLWALCDRLGRAEEASRYLKVALLASYYFGYEYAVLSRNYLARPEVELIEAPDFPGSFGVFPAKTPLADLLRHLKGTT